MRNPFSAANPSSCEASAGAGEYVRYGKASESARPRVAATLALLVVAVVAVACLGSVLRASAPTTSVLLIEPNGGEERRVHSLPGAPPLRERHYAGYALANRTAGNHLFYWLVESHRPPRGRRRRWHCRARAEALCLRNEYTQSTHKRTRTYATERHPSCQSTVSRPNSEQATPQKPNKPKSPKMRQRLTRTNIHLRA